VLLDEILSIDGERLVARVSITEGSPFFEAGGVPAIVTLEYMAQAIAAFSGAQRRKEGETVQLGFLLGCRKMTLEVDKLLPGDELRVEARHVWSAAPLGQFDCNVSRGGHPIAKAVLSVYEGPLEPEAAAT
jgi:predicted hotdog family 3-hydroxylacyl-ACP dehydratase